MEDNVTESISEEEKKLIAEIYNKRQLALAQAEAALAKNQATELEYRNLILSLFMKYQLNPAKDSIDENGRIVRGSSDGGK